MPSWSNSLWQGWSCGLVYCPGGNATDSIWRVLVSFEGISYWAPLKPQHSNPNPNPLSNQLWCIDFLTPPTPLIILHRLPAFLESIMPLKNWCSIYEDGRKAVCSIPYVSVAFLPSLKQNFIAYPSSKVSSRPDCNFEIHQLWQSGFSRVYSNSCSSCSFEAEIIKIGQSSHKMYSNHRLFDGVRFQYSQVLAIFLFSKRSDFFLVWQFYSFCYSSFSPFHYEHGTFFYFKFYFFILAVYSYCLYQCLQFFFLFYKQFDVIHVHKVINLFLSAKFFFSPAVDSTIQFFLGFRDEVYDFVGYFVHFETFCYTSWREQIIAFLKLMHATAAFSGFVLFSLRLCW